MRAWIEIASVTDKNYLYIVALFMRAWIEISIFGHFAIFYSVALFMRAWIEIASVPLVYPSIAEVALFMRAWIEIYLAREYGIEQYSRPLHEGVD